MRIKDVLLERWTATTVKKYFDSKDNAITKQDFTVSHPIDGCIMFKFESVPNLARTFFRMGEYYEAQYNVELAEFLDRFVDDKGEVNYFKFWDGFNITDQGFRSWLRKNSDLTQAEKVLVDAVKKHTKTKRFCIIGVAGNDPATVNHELFHALYYLQSDYQSQVDQLLKEFRKDSAYKTMASVLKSKLDYVDNVDEEIAAYLTARSQLKMVFGVDPQDWSKKFAAVFNAAIKEYKK
jgi:hypothetical protein